MWENHKRRGSQFPIQCLFFEIIIRCEGHRLFVWNIKRIWKWIIASDTSSYDRSIATLKLPSYSNLIHNYLENPNDYQTKSRSSLLIPSTTAIYPSPTMVDINATRQTEKNKWNINRLRAPITNWKKKNARDKNMISAHIRTQWKGKPVCRAAIAHSNSHS